MKVNIKATNYSFQTISRFTHNGLKEISYKILSITRCSVFKLYLHWKIMMSTHFLCLYFLRAIALKPLLNKCVASFCSFCYKSLLMRSSCILLILSSHNL